MIQTHTTIVNPSYIVFNKCVDVLSIVASKLYCRGSAVITETTGCFAISRRFIGWILTGRSNLQCTPMEFYTLAYFSANSQCVLPSVSLLGEGMVYKYH